MADTTYVEPSEWEFHQDPEVNPVMLKIEERHLARIFEEWDRRWRERPQEFMDLVTHLTRETPLTYGQACAPYFIKLANELEVNQS